MRPEINDTVMVDLSKYIIIGFLDDGMLLCQLWSSYQRNTDENMIELHKGKLTSLGIKGKWSYISYSD